MSEQKYIGIDVDGLGITCELQPNGTYKALHIDEVVALLNTPTTPAAGIVWRKPGEPGRVSGKRYLVWWSDGDTTFTPYNTCPDADKWGSVCAIAWADLPSPPAWATGGAA